MKTQLVASLLIVAASAASLNLKDDIEIRDCGNHNVYKSAKIKWSINDGEDGFVTSFGVNDTPVVYKWSFLVLGGAINSNDLWLIL